MEILFVNSQGAVLDRLDAAMDPEHAKRQDPPFHDDDGSGSLYGDPPDINDIDDNEPNEHHFYDDYGQYNMSYPKNTANNHVNHNNGSHHHVSHNGNGNYNGSHNNGNYTRHHSYEDFERTKTAGNNSNHNGNNTNNANNANNANTRYNNSYDDFDNHPKSSAGTTTTTYGNPNGNANNPRYNSHEEFVDNNRPTKNASNANNNNNTHNGNTNVGGVDEGDALDLEEVNRMSTQEDYELVYFSKESRLISFESVSPTTGSNVEDDENSKVRVNVYWTSGTVGTCLVHQHPTRGRTRQTVRHNVDLRELNEIFRNPRVSSHGGYSTQHNDDDIPPPNNGHVRAIAQLQETNAMLCDQLNATQMVQITGPRGMPVYATGSFKDGRRVGGGLWGVDLAMVSNDGDDNSKSKKVNLSALEDIEIRLGGVLYASSRSHEVKAQMTNSKDYDGDKRKEVQCHFGGPVTGVRLPVRVSGWPKSHWSNVQRRDLSRRDNAYRPNLDVYGLLLEEVRETYPRAQVSFHRVSFFGNCVEGMVTNLIDNNNNSQLNDGNKREEEKEEELWNIANLIVATLREAGCEDVGEPFMKRVNDVQMAAYVMLSVNNETNEGVEAEVGNLVRFQLESRSTADFLSQVGMRYDISKLVGN